MNDPWAPMTTDFTDWPVTAEAMGPGRNVRPRSVPTNSARCPAQFLHSVYAGAIGTAFSQYTAAKDARHYDEAISRQEARTDTLDGSSTTADSLCEQRVHFRDIEADVGHSDGLVAFYAVSRGC
jgi:hypothetical protein